MLPLLLAQAQAQSPIVHLFRSAGTLGLLILSLGVVLTMWGVINLLTRQPPLVTVLQTLCSLIPAVLAAGVVYASYQEFMRIAASPEPPEAVEFARVISSGLTAGMIGPLASVVPAALGIAALARVAQREQIADGLTNDI